jgi:hypothetical protein
MDHPVVTVVAESALRGDTERYVLDDEALLKLDQTLVAYAEDPTLPGGLRGLMGLATTLLEKEGSPTAATNIFCAIGRNVPHYAFLRSGNGAFGNELVGRLKIFLDDKKVTTAPQFGAKAPAGTLKVSSFGVGKTRRP